MDKLLSEKVKLPRLSLEKAESIEGDITFENDPENPEGGGGLEHDDAESLAGGSISPAQDPSPSYNQLKSMLELMKPMMEGLKG